MARSAAGQPDRRRSGADSTDTGQAAFTAANQTTPWCALAGPFTYMVGAGAVGGTVVLEASFDGGTTAVAFARPDGATTALAAPLVMRCEGSPENDVVFRLRCAALTSGSMPWRLSQ